MQTLLYLAPLHGITNYVYRNVFYRHFSGIDAAMAPFINSINSETAYAKSRGNHFKDLHGEFNAGHALVPQILGNTADSFIETATTIAGFGYNEVNWNLGCPYPMVTNKKRGAGLLPHRDLIEKFLDEACQGVKIDISVKVRLGLTGSGDLPALMPVFNSHPIKKIIIHPRIGTQMYTGKVDLDGFAAAAALSKHPVMYNGDIRDVASFSSLRERFPFVGEWMIGRWAVANPFIFSQIKNSPPESDPLGKVKAFHDELYSRYREILFGQSHALDKMKEIWTYLGTSFADAERPLKNISRSKNTEMYESAVKAVFADCAWKA